MPAMKYKRSSSRLNETPVEIMTPIEKTRRANIIQLYRNMPGAPRPPREDGIEMWGDVEGNEHWDFCAAIIDQMTIIAMAYAN